MKNKTILKGLPLFLALLFFLAIGPGSALAADNTCTASDAGDICYLDYYGTDRTSLPYLWANVGDPAANYFITAVLEGKGTGKIHWYDATGVQVGVQSVTLNGQQTINFVPEEARGLKLSATDGEIHLAKTTTNSATYPTQVFSDPIAPTPPTTTEPPPTTEPEPPPPTPPGYFLHGSTGGIFSGSPYYNPDNNAIGIDFNTDQVASITLQSWSAGYGEMLVERQLSASDDGYTHYIGNNFTCNTDYKAFYHDASGAQIGSMDISVSNLVNPTCDSGAAGNGATGGTCDSCAIFQCPGWDEYMSKLDGIKAAIPPPTDWRMVADIFRDTIAPRIKQDLQDVLGSAPTPPSVATGPVLTKPNVTAPTAPPSLGGVNDNGLTAPTGQEAPGLDGSTFTSDDIKNGAPSIPERTDPTGGFQFSDPIGGLPSQEDFISNAPIEAPVPLPTPPVGEEFVDPGDPITEPTFTEPTFTDPIIGAEPVIGGPTIDYESTPIPSGSTSSAPTDPVSPTPGEPGDPTFTDPTIDYNTAPIPGADGSTAPMPGG